MMRPAIKKIQILLALFLVPTIVFAAQKNMGFGDVASELIQPVGVLNNFIGSASIIIGVICLFASFFRYQQYRVNALASPLSGVIVLFVLGLILLGLPFFYMVLEGVPITLHRK